MSMTNFDSSHRAENRGEAKSDIYYHGSGLLFDRFDLGHNLVGSGRMKFGYGIYLTSSFSSAAHYSGCREEWTSHYVYTVDIPEVTIDNTLYYHLPVNIATIQKASEVLGVAIPDRKCLTGKEFRKFISATLYRRLLRDAEITDGLPPSKLESEKTASELLLKVGIEYIVWPYNWRHPWDGFNIVVFDETKIKIKRVESVALDNKKQLIPGSEKVVL